MLSLGGGGQKSGYCGPKNVSAKFRRDFLEIITEKNNSNKTIEVFLEKCLNYNHTCANGNFIPICMLIVSLIDHFTNEWSKMSTILNFK